MPSLNYTFLKQLKCNLDEYTVFIETGTHTGDTIFAMERYFTNLYTIELSPFYFNTTKNKYNGQKITFVLGDSAVELANVLQSVNEKPIIFLDGHYSSGNTAQGSKDCPLIEEITAIATHCKTGAVIIVDDYRLFSKGPKEGYNEDWSEINKDKLLSILSSRVSDVYHLDSVCAKDDRLIIHINPL